MSQAYDGEVSEVCSLVRRGVMGAWEGGNGSLEVLGRGMCRG